ncbi:DIP1984 family protein [Cytobacillus firmus]|uniref:DIP1984 family protein n=1 Tax=Cytobacillus firmus TaxID=1399 RepID=UPI00222829D4|nr:DIP1984 family protein [Cytobacillus firmus]
MQKLTLAEAVKLKSVLAKRIHELEEEMDRVAFADIEKGSKLPEMPRSLAMVEKEMDEVRKDMRLLDKLVYKANIENDITFNNESLPIVEAIELATQYRAKARKFKEYGTAAREEFLYTVSENVSMVKMALFDPEQYRLKGLEAERQANRLSNLINNRNYLIELEFDSEKYF